MVSLGAAALAYARRGMKVFPLKPRGKTPLTAHGFKEASSDSDQVKSWWKEHPDANIGIATGEASGIWVLDVDGEVGAVSFMEMQAANEVLWGPAQSTGKGQHLLFQWTEPVKNSAGKIGAGIDVRGDGGYIVAAPSMHPSGAQYRWLKDRGPLGPAPAWLAALHKTKAARPAEKPEVDFKVNFADVPESYGRKALEGEYTAVSAAGEGRRNEALNTAAFNMGTLAAVDGVRWSDVETTLMGAAGANGQLAEDGAPAILAVIKSGFEAGLQHPREMKPSNKPPRGQRPRLAAVDGNLAVAVQPNPPPKSQFTTNASGGLKANSLHNAASLITDDEALRGLFVLNEFTGQVAVTRRPPWTVNGYTIGGALSDEDVAGCAIYMERACGFSITTNNLHSAIRFIASENHINPVRDYMSALVWDEKARLSDWLCDYMDAPQTGFVRTVASRWMIGAVARIMRPGSKVDTMLILEGHQGLKKSTALAALATIGGIEYFADKLPALDNKDAAMEIQGKIIVEIAELDALRKAEASQIKAWLSQCTDRFRPPYGRSVVERPRQCVFAGTVNPGATGYLNDPTGGRRFWPVPVHHIELNALIAAAPQLWAEAVARYRAGENWWLDEEAAEEAREQQRDRFTTDVWADKIDEFVVGKTSVRLFDIMIEKLQLPVTLQNDATAKRIGSHLRFRGWERKKRRESGKPIWVFVREGDEDGPE